MKTDVIAERLKNLIDMVSEFKKENHDGHLGIMQRQDHTNGTVCEHSEEIAKIKTENAETLAYLKGMFKILTWVALVTPCIVGSIFGLYMYYVRNEITKEINMSIEENNRLQFNTYNIKEQ